MAEQSKIAWTDSTANFWSGCTKVSPGCANCYAEELSGRFNTFGKWGKGAPRQLHESAFKLAAKLNRKPFVCDACGHAEPQPARDKACPQCPCGSQAGYHRRRIFSLSLGDWLDPEVPIEWLARMLDTIRQCPDVDWLLCTKRPELWNQRMELAQRYVLQPTCNWLADWHCLGIPPSNVIILTSVENQEAADKRIPELLRIPAWRRGLSCEPLLGPVELRMSVYPVEKLNWVIIGGESGNKARPCNVDWVRSLKDQCKAASVPCFVKQLGTRAVASEGAVALTIPNLTCVGGVWRLILNDKKGGDWNEWPEDLKVREFYKS